MEGNSLIFTIPKPDKCKTYIELQKCGKYGLLKKKEIGLFRITWKKRYVALSNGCMYMFKSEQCQSYDKAFSLFGFNEISKAQEVKSKDATHPFKICFAVSSEEKMKYFSADSDAERIEWMVAIKREMTKVHRIDYESDADSSIDNTEIPISSRDYFEYIQRKYVIEEDSDLESEYRPIEATSFTSPSTVKLPEPPKTINIQLKNNSTNAPPVMEKPNFEKSARWNNSPVEGQRFLVKYGREGSYMVRKSADSCDVLLVISDFQPRKYKIYKEKDMLFLEKNNNYFKDIHSLILYYRSNPLPNRKTKLIEPYTFLRNA